MMEHLVWLIAGYCFLTALLAFFVIRTPVSSTTKFVTVIATSAFAYVSYAGWRDAQGWPTAMAVPEDFLLHHSVVEEPDPQTGDKGSIYIWLAEVKNNIPNATPRVHRLPYTLEMHKKLEEAKRKQAQGQPQIGQRQAKPPNAELADRQSIRSQNIIAFRDLPDTALPDK